MNATTLQQAIEQQLDSIKDAADLGDAAGVTIKVKFVKHLLSRYTDTQAVVQVSEEYATFVQAYHNRKMRKHSGA